jgi:ATP-binding protein involved in chromosome partitioning
VAGLISEDNRLIPLSNYGIKSMSMGYLVGESSPVVWRGLMVMKAIQQLLHEVDWGGLDVLVLDLPPGTGDIQLTITQQVKLDGAVIVSTPQNLSVKDSVRGINMFRKVDVPILGMVQNMSMFQCSNCGHEEHIFGSDGVKRACEDLGVKLLGDIPLHAKIAQDTEEGKPSVVADPDGGPARSFKAIADQVATLVGL